MLHYNRPHDQTADNDVGKTRTWPKRKKRRGPQGPLGQFRPVGEEDPLGTPAPTSSAHPTQRATPGEGTPVAPKSLEWMSVSTTPSSAKFLDSSTVSSEVFQDKSSFVSKSTNSLESDGNNNDGDDDDSGKGGFQNGGMGSIKWGNTNVDQRPHVTNYREGDKACGASDSKKGSAFVGHDKKTTPKKTKTKIFSKKLKLMQRIQKFRMKRKIKLKL